MSELALPVIAGIRGWRMASSRGCSRSLMSLTVCARYDHLPVRPWVKVPRLCVADFGQ